MSGPNGLNDCTWDGASCVAMRWGATKVPVLKFTPSKIDIKREKVRRVGQVLADKRTPGVTEIGDATVEILSSDYEEYVLPRLGKHAGSDIEFTVTCTISHPTVKGSLSRLMDHVTIIGIEGPDIEPVEKSLITKLTLSVLDLYEKGRDGVWKTLVRKSGLPSSDAKAQLQF